MAKDALGNLRNFSGYHQKCHDPVIPAKALEYETPWHCTFCMNGAKNPHIEENPFCLTKRKTFDKITNKEQTPERNQERSSKIYKEAEEPFNHHTKGGRNSGGPKDLSMNKRQNYNERESKTLENKWYRPRCDEEVVRFNVTGSRSREDSYRARVNGFKHHSNMWIIGRPNAAQAVQQYSQRPNSSRNNENIAKRRHLPLDKHNRGFRKSQERTGRQNQKSSLRERMAKRYVPMIRPYMNTKKAEDVNRNYNCDRNNVWKKNDSEQEKLPGRIIKQVEEDELKRKKHQSIIVDGDLKEKDVARRREKEPGCPLFVKKLPQSRGPEAIFKSGGNAQIRHDRTFPGSNRQLTISAKELPNREESKSVESGKEMCSQSIIDSSDHVNKSKRLSADPNIDALGTSNQSSAFSFIKKCFTEKPGSMDKHRSELKTDYRKFRAEGVEEGHFQCRHSDACKGMSDKSSMLKQTLQEKVTLDVSQSTLRCKTADKSMMHEEEATEFKGTLRSKYKRCTKDSSTDKAETDRYDIKEIAEENYTEREDIRNRTSSNDKETVDRVLSRHSAVESPGISRRDSQRTEHTKRGSILENRAIDSSKETNDYLFSMNMKKEDGMKLDNCTDQSIKDIKTECKLFGGDELEKCGVKQEIVGNDIKIEPRELEADQFTLKLHPAKILHSPSELLQNEDENSHNIDMASKYDDQTKNECFLNGLPLKDAQEADSVIDQDPCSKNREDLFVQCADNDGTFFGFRISEVFSLKSGPSPILSLSPSPLLKVTKNKRADQCGNVQKSKEENFEAHNASQDQMKACLDEGKQDLYTSSDNEERPVDGNCHVNEEALSSGMEEEQMTPGKSIPKESAMALSKKRNLELMGNVHDLTKPVDNSLQSEPAQTSVSEQSHSEHKGKKKSKKAKSNASSPVNANIFDRISMDLPRHNWLIERLVNERKLGSDDFRGDENLQNENRDTEKKPRKIKKRLRLSSKRKSSDGDGPENETSETKPTQVESHSNLSKAQVSDENTHRCDPLAISDTDQKFDSDKIELDSLNWANTMKNNTMELNRHCLSLGKEEAVGETGEEEDSPVSESVESHCRSGEECDVTELEQESFIRKKPERDVTLSESVNVEVKLTSGNGNLTIKQALSVASLHGNQKADGETPNLEKMVKLENMLPQEPERNSSLKVSISMARLSPNKVGLSPVNQNRETEDKNERSSSHYKEDETQKQRANIVLTSRQGKISNIVSPFILKSKIKTEEDEATGRSGDSTFETQCYPNRIKTKELSKKQELDLNATDKLNDIGKISEKHSLGLHHLEIDRQESGDLVRPFYSENKPLKEKPLSSCSGKQQISVNALATDSFSTKGDKTSPMTKEPSTEDCKLFQKSNREYPSSSINRANNLSNGNILLPLKAAITEQNLNRETQNFISPEKKPTFDGIYQIQKHSSPDRKRDQLGGTSSSKFVDRNIISSNNICANSSYFDVIKNIVPTSDFGSKPREEVQFYVRNSLRRKLEQNQRNLSVPPDALNSVESNFHPTAKNVTSGDVNASNHMLYNREEIPFKKQRIATGTERADIRSFSNDQQSRPSSEQRHDSRKSHHAASPQLNSIGATILGKVKDDSISAATKDQLLAYWRDVKCKAVNDQQCFDKASSDGPSYFNSNHERRSKSVSQLSPYASYHGLRIKDGNNRKSRTMSDSAQGWGIPCLPTSPNRNITTVCTREVERSLEPRGYPDHGSTVTNGHGPVNRNQNLLKCCPVEGEITRNNQPDRRQVHVESVDLLNGRGGSINILPGRKIADPMMVRHKSSSFNCTEMPFLLENRKRKIVEPPQNRIFQPGHTSATYVDTSDIAFNRGESPSLGVQQHSPMDSSRSWSTGYQANTLKVSVREESGFNRLPLSDARRIPGQRNEIQCKNVYSSYPEGYRSDNPSMVKGDTQHRYMFETGIHWPHESNHGQTRERFVGHHGLDKYRTIRESPPNYNKRPEYQFEMAQQYQQHRQTEMLPQRNIQNREPAQRLEDKETQKQHHQKAAFLKRVEQFQSDYQQQQRVLNHASSYEHEQQQHLNATSLEHQYEREVMVPLLNNPLQHPMPERHLQTLPGQSQLSPGSFQRILPYPVSNDTSLYIHESPNETGILEGKLVSRALPRFRSTDKLSTDAQFSDGRPRNLLCQLCKSAAKFVCSRCRTATYCSDRCQVEDWKTHGKRCKTVPKS
ncbi:uncharacterized protein LOC135683907 isoform X1 [Rhopilema esculentum]|uniref:uncharacterized protein LOC135683907 isoform X1 n=2 Tax=Rhopilema esculentum TaxID=499914 RepID=UPI0031DD96DB